MILLIHRLIERHWYQPNYWLTILLWLPARLFSCIAVLRRRYYLSRQETLEKLPVPVVVIGNIHAGGTGKTPLVLAIVRSLQAQGVKVGVISRGYGRSSRGTHILNASSTTDDAGDEPLLIYRQTGVPCAVGSSRLAAAKALLTAFPDVSLIIADDGLQHYALQRDYEIAVFPYADYQRSSALDVLPNGPLREPLQRLNTVDAVVVSGCPNQIGLDDQLRCEIGENLALRPSELSCALFVSSVINGTPYRLNHPEEIVEPTSWHDKRVAALAGIAKPERFFATLRAAGVELNTTIVLPDHANLSEHDLPDADIVVITEKDAVKLAGVERQNVFVWPVCAIIQPDLAQWLLHQINHH